MNCEGVYSNVALKGLYDAVVASPTVGNFVEIGCEYGRSTSLIAQLAKDRNQYLVCIDPFVKSLLGSGGDTVAAHTFGMLTNLDVKFAFLRGYSYEAPYPFGPIAFLHVDGNHSVPFLLSDIHRFVPMVMDGGYMAFHDYGNQGPYSEDVKRTLDAIIENAGWEMIANSDTCLTVKKHGPYEKYYFPDGGRP